MPSLSFPKSKRANHTRTTSVNTCVKRTLALTLRRVRRLHARERVIWRATLIMCTLLLECASVSTRKIRYLPVFLIRRVYFARFKGQSLRGPLPLHCLLRLLVLHQDHRLRLRLRLLHFHLRTYKCPSSPTICRRRRFKCMLT